MTRFITYIIFSLSACILATAASPDQFLLRGYIRDTEHHSVDSVEISIVKNDSIPVPFKLLRGNDAEKLAMGGELRALVDGGLGEYTLTLHKDGYDLLIKNFKIASKSENVKYIYDVVMKKEIYRELNEVTVSTTRVKMVMKGDTVVFDAAAFQLEEGSMLDALVRQLPNATLSPDGVITVNGRKINELLVNGKDFFKGDPKVALQNLPSYTVKNIKVYDKAADDAYLTHSDARIAQREEDENLVMDVVLKKEYNTGWMANLEAGYGTEDRYMVRGFGLGYTDCFRLAGYVNFNNTGDHSQAGTSGQWSHSYGRRELVDIAMGGLDYNYKDNKRVEVNGRVNLTGEKSTSHTISASTRFFPSGDIFDRSEGFNLSKVSSVSTSHSFMYKGDNFFLYINPDFSWRHNSGNSESRSATFSSQPYETYRGQALDSVFSGKTTSYTKDLLTRLRRMNISASYPDQLNGNLNLGSTISPKNWRGRLAFNMTGSYSRSGSDSRTLYDQAYGPASTATTPPQRTDNYNHTENKNTSLTTNLSYYHSIRKFKEKQTTTFTFYTGVIYSYNKSNSDQSNFRADMLPDPLTPPSLTRPEYLQADAENSPYTRNGQSQGVASAGLSISREPTAPGDSTLNPSLTASLNFRYGLTHETYYFHKPGTEAQDLSRNTGFFNPTISLSFNSANKIRNLNFNIGYSFSPSAPALSYMISNRNTSNPLNVILGNPDGLRNSYSHSVNVYWGRYSRAASHTSFSIHGNWRVNTSTVAYARRYDPATGITVSRPENISGNWSANVGMAASTDFGSEKNFSFNAGIGSSYTNSSDYMSIDTEPVRNSVRNMSLSPNIGLTYRLKNGSTISTGMSMSTSHQESPREGFNNLTWYTYSPYVNAFIKLPSDFGFNTQFTPFFRRGYADPAMNTSEWVWNATATKSICHGKLTFKFTAVDILASVKHVYTSVNAQGHTETWQNVLPRYVLLTLNYRLDMKPKKKQN